MTNLLSHPALVSIPAACAVIVVVAMFLRSQRAYSQAHREERLETAEVLKEMAEDSKTVAEDFTKLIRDIQEQRLKEQAALLELYRAQTICMQQIVAKCQR
jgi:thymidylate kinase